MWKREEVRRRKKKVLPIHDLRIHFLFYVCGDNKMTARCDEIYPPGFETQVRLETWAGSKRDKRNGIQAFV